MTCKILYSLALVLLAAVPAGLYAQQPDTSATTPATEAVQENIIGKSMQPRYKPYNQPFHKGGFLSNTYVTVLGYGIRQFAQNYSNGPYLGVGIEKWIARCHGVRLSAGAGYFFDNTNVTRVKNLDVRLSYMFNVSDYVDGYQPMRLVEVIPVAGLGYMLTFSDGWNRSSGVSAHMGTDIIFRVLPGIDVMVEPLLELTQDSRGLSRMDVWRNYLLGYRIGIGARIALDKYHWGADPGKQWFVNVTGGIQWQNSALLRSMSFIKAIGPNYSLGFGRYYGKAYAIRLSGGYGYHYWKEVREGESDIYGQALEAAKYPSSYIFARLDGMIDFVGMFSKNESRWSASVMGGPEVGLLRKKDPSPDHKDIRYLYVGVTAALQGKCRLWKGLGVFVEPRLSIVPYAADAYMTSTRNRNYYDAVFDLSLGLEYKFGNNH